MEEHNGMHIPYPYQIQGVSDDERHGRALSDIPCTVRTVYSVSGRAKGRFNFEVPFGKQSIDYSKFLDAHLPGGRIADRNRNIAKACKDFFQHLTTKRKTSRQQYDDPIFWMYGIRWQIRQASRTLTDLEHGEKLRDPSNISRGDAPRSNDVFKSMASWAHRYRGSKSGIDKLRGRVFNGLCEPGPTTIDVYDPETFHWLLWDFQARGISRQEIFMLEFYPLFRDIPKSDVRHFKLYEGRVGLEFPSEWRETYLGTKKYYEMAFREKRARAN